VELCELYVNVELCGAATSNGPLETQDIKFLDFSFKHHPRPIRRRLFAKLQIT
jgi:hypothetical protein